MPRRFELRAGSSQKFWEIRLSGDSIAVRFGKIGTDGQSQTVTFASPEKARAGQTKRIAENPKTGYVEVGGGKGSEPSRGKTRKELEALAEAAPKVDVKDPL